jgi:hypothetical protein
MYPVFLLSQTPYTSIKFSVIDNPGNENPAGKITIYEKVCEFDYEPVVPSGDYWFGKDTSQLNWDALPDSMYNRLNCKEYIIDSAEVYYSVHHMAWEEIFCYKIVRENHLGIKDSMTIVFPILVKSFVTFLNLGLIPFKPGYFELTNAIVYTADPVSKKVSFSFPADYKWESIEYKDRKIKLE